MNCIQKGLASVCFSTFARVNISILCVSMYILYLLYRVPHIGIVRGHNFIGQVCKRRHLLVDMKIIFYKTKY